MTIICIHKNPNAIYAAVATSVDSYRRDAVIFQCGFMRDDNHNGDRSEVSSSTSTALNNL